MALAANFSCGDRRPPQAIFDHATRSLRRGQVQQSQKEAAAAVRRYRDSDPRWAQKFLVLEAQAALERGLNEDVLSILKSEPLSSNDAEIRIPALMLAGIANANKHQFDAAEQFLSQASRLCTDSTLPSCGYVLQGRGLLASEQSDSDSAERLYTQSAAFAHTHGDLFLEANSLLNLGAESLAEGRYDEAIDRSEAAHQAAKAADAGILELDSIGNIGWAYYKLGDSERALERFLEAERRAEELGDIADQGTLLTNAAYVYQDSRNFALAEQDFRRALDIEQSPAVDSKENIYNALRALARLYLQTGDLDKASGYAERALTMAGESRNRFDELYPLLVRGQVAARRGRGSEAESIFREVEHDPHCPVFMKWEAQHSLARLYEDEKRADEAEPEYRAALGTFETARAAVRHEDFQLSFLTNASRIYDDYVHFLITRGNSTDALRWADYDRARTLSEGLGLLAGSTPHGNTAIPSLNAQEIASRLNGTLLFYWLGEKQSYLWAITPQKTQLFSLPPGAEIETAVQRYRRALGGPQDVLASANEDGVALYRMLVAPALETRRPRDSRQGAGTTKIFIIPDGGLNNLNFETLIVPGPTPHFWIDDATVADASSLRLLSANYASRKKQARRLLLVGNSIAPSKEYPELPQAGPQMDSVAQHFPSTARLILARDRATPAAYLASDPERFSHIHFVAHGTASRLSPLDSAIVLSRESAGSESFKLYARDIIRHQLRADLVTISACYGAGERSYSGEGLVGLSWAFLRAGAHNVIAALWEATDVSTEQLMGKFYDELDKGARPDAALRAAKLSLLHSSNFRNPFYWAPFQLYSGS